MKFFIPAAKDKDQEDRVYNSIKQFLKDELGANMSERKIFSLSYKHNGNNYYAEVGKNDEIEKDVVIAILYEKTRDLYHICTPNRGVVRGMSILVGAHDAISVTDFDE